MPQVTERDAVFVKIDNALARARVIPIDMVQRECAALRAMTASEVSEHILAVWGAPVMPLVQPFLSQLEAIENEAKS